MTLVQNVLLGAYIGILTGIFTALLVFGLTFAFMYVAGVKFPVIYALLIALGGAGLQGGVRIFMRNPELLTSATGVVAFLIVMAMALYAHDRGEKLGEALPPKTILFRGLQQRALSSDIVKEVGRFGQVRIRTVGEVNDMEGYLPLPDDIRTAIRDGEWTFPTDLPIHELERRLAEKLVTEFDLEDVTVSIDPKGRAAITAAPPSGRLSRRTPPDKVLVAMDVLLPSGIAEGDEIRADLADTRIAGRVVSADTRPADEPVASDGSPDDDAEADGDEVPDRSSREPSPRGGRGRVAIAVDPEDVPDVNRSDVAQFVVKSRGKNREYELVSLLRDADNGFEKVSLRAGSEVVDRSVGELRFRDTYGVAILGIKRADEWFFAPDAQTVLTAEDDLFVAGPRDRLDELRGLIA